MLRGLRDSLTGDLHAGVAVWAVDGVSRRDLTSIANATDVDAMEDVARLPYCAAVPPPYSEQAETYSNYFCVGDPPAVQDEDHAYDLRHDASQVWGLTTGTYYAQALREVAAIFQHKPQNKTSVSKCVYSASIGAKNAQDEPRDE